MNQSILNNNTPTAPSPLILGIASECKNDFDYYFIIKKRSFFCYKNYLRLELDNQHYIINYNNGILQIPRCKTKEFIIDILKTIGIKNNHIFRVSVMKGQILMSKKRFYDLNSIINFVNKTELIMENVKHN